MLQNANEVIQFLNRIRALARSQNLFLDFSDVEEITPEAIAVFLATINHRDVANAQIMGNLPTQEHLKRMMNESGFRDYVRSTDVDVPRARVGSIRKRLRSGEALAEKFNQFTANDLILFATERMTGKHSGHRPTYAVLAEAMLNTVYHASGTSGDPEPWWASVYCDHERGKMCFTFIDQGVGIFRSTRLSLRLRIARLVFATNADILRELMHGEIPSSSKVPGRGNGIPSMYTHCRAARIKRLTVISNDAMGEAETEEYSALQSWFDGTILHWEVQP